MAPANTMLSQTMAALVAELREAEPYMKDEAIAALARETVDFVRDRVKAQQPGAEEIRARTGFMSLSPELRNRVYELALIPEQPCDDEGEPFDSRTYSTVTSVDGLRRIMIHADRFSSDTEKRYANWMLQPALTLVSKQVRAETLPIYYGQNTFIFDAEPTLEMEERNCSRCTTVQEPSVPTMATGLKWLKMIGTSNASMIRNILVSEMVTYGEIEYQLRAQPWQVLFEAVSERLTALGVNAVEVHLDDYEAKVTLQLKHGSWELKRGWSASEELDKILTRMLNDG